MLEPRRCGPGPYYRVRVVCYRGRELSAPSIPELFIHILTPIGTLCTWGQISQDLVDGYLMDGVWWVESGPGSQDQLSVPVPSLGNQLSTAPPVFPVTSPEAQQPRHQHQHPNRAPPGRQAPVVNDITLNIPSHLLKFHPQSHPRM